ncbi:MULTISPECIES: response regulator transcription factor [Caproicibacterium]|uniref:Stage 0 sporulation protein A homolog n=1 Tax=Caproicibacterium argilliputei TaxID=3030016 RepID=A0AA97D7E1_9FIRM|nr:response regulator transcription factor [Caproicibacterium argilliputei]WOC31699.1 response regulator transcription factor [Caproicibacterium argilliputei]
MYKILIVEDDAIIASAVAKHLSGWGMQPKAVRDFHAVDLEFAAFDPQLVLLDLSLPFYNGFHWCEQIRQISKVPILFLSSAADNMNMVMAMNLGADDFIAKPFDLNVLTAKIQAVLRRTYAFGTPEDLLACGGAILNLSEATVTFNEQKTALSKNELKILQSLFESAGKVVRREDLMARLWETDCYIDENTLTVNINRLRRKLAKIGLNDLILTKKGLGYLVKS